MIETLLETGPTDVDHALRVSPSPTAGPIFGSLIVEAKQCSKCKQIKALSAFCRNPNHADGLQSQCRECQREAWRQWHAANGERHKERCRRWHAAHREQVRQRSRRWHARHPLANRARHRVQRAIRTGKLVPHPCESCGFEKVAAHHDDYEKPLDVRWLCRSCHKRLHVRHLSLI